MTARVERERGSAIVTSVLLMAAFLILGGAFLSVALTDSLIASNEVASVRAFHAAEAGLAHARVDLGTADVTALLGDQHGLLLSDMELGGSTYGVVVRNNVAPEFPRNGIPADSGGSARDTDGYLVVSSTARCRNATKTIEVVVKAGSFPGTEWAVFGDFYLSAHVHGTLNGPVGTNGDMVLRVNINGDAQAGGRIDHPERVHGRVTTKAPKVRFASVGCPTGDFGLSPIGPGVTFDPIDGNVEIGGSADTRFPAGTYYFYDFRKTGTGRMIVESGATVDIYVKGRMLVEGNGFQNDNNSAAKLRIWGCGARNDDWVLAGNTPTWMFLYGIHHPLRILGTGAKNGSFIAASIFKSGAGPVIYDGSLKNELAAAFDEIPGTWTERLD